MGKIERVAQTQRRNLHCIQPSPTMANAMLLKSNIEQNSVERESLTAQEESLNQNGFDFRAL